MSIQGKDRFLTLVQDHLLMKTKTYFAILTKFYMLLGTMKFITMMLVT